VTLIARGAHLAALRESGLRVRSVMGDFEARVAATDDPAEVGPVDVILFTVKSYDTDEAARSLRPMLRQADGRLPATAVVSLQNGVDNEERIAAAIGREHVVGGVAYILTSIAEPGVVDHVGGPTSLVFGELDGRRSARVEQLLETCRQAEIKAEVADDIRLALWAKYAFLCALAGMTAAVRLPIGEIRANPAASAMLRQLIEEGWRVARAESVALPDDYVERQMAFVETIEPGGYSSLYHDLMKGHRMELEALHGELLRRAQRAGVDAPATRTVYAVLSPWAGRNDPRAG
jgi:2-dehydropantoate 2-reductase